MTKNLTSAIRAMLAATLLSTTAGAHEESPSRTLPPYFDAEPFPDDTGVIATHSSENHVNKRGAFFQSLGINGRSCATCHQADQAMSISPPQIRERFHATRGRDPLFAAVDGANCPNAKTSDAAAHSLLLKYGLVRTFLPLPATAQFTVTVVHDPYGCAISTDPRSGRMVVSEYRRPLPTTNLRFLSTMMFDGRESPAATALNSPVTFAANLNADLTHQAQTAVAVHFQATDAPTAAQLKDIVDFEASLTTAQVYDESAGLLESFGAKGGLRTLVEQNYYPGVNDVLGADPNGSAFDSASMQLFDSWADSRYSYEDDQEDDRRFEFGRGSRSRYERAAARRDIAAGEVLFNTAPLTITAVRGLNDNPALGGSFQGTCTTCHDTPNVGNHSLPLPLDIGTGHTPKSGLESDPVIAQAIAELDEPDLPVYLVNGCPSPFSAGQPVSFYTTDLGKGLVTGLCSDLNRVKGPILRGLAARAPYFHNGAAASLTQAVNFYNRRFTMNLTDQQIHQLVAFLNSL